MTGFRAKAYANKHDKADGKKGHISVAATVEEFAALLKGKNKEEFDRVVLEAVKDAKT